MTSSPPQPPVGAPSGKRRRKRDVLGLVAGIATAAVVAVAVIGGCVVLLLASGFVPLAGLQRYVETNLESRLGPGWQVTAAKAGIIRDDGRPTLQIQNAEFVHASGLRMRAPETKIRFNPIMVLTGEFRPTELDLRGLSLRLKVNADGALALDTGDGEITLPESPGRPADEPLVGRVVGIVAAALSPQGLFPQFERITVSQSSLTLVAPNGSERIGLQNVMARLDGAASDRSLSIRGLSPSGENEITIRRTAPENAEPAVELRAVSFRLGDLEALFVGRENILTTGLPLTGSVTLAGPQMSQISGRLQFGAGEFKPQGVAAAGLKIDGLNAVFSGPATLAHVDFQTLAVRAGQTSLDGQGRLTHEGFNWEFGGEWRGRLAGEGGDAPQTVDRLAISLKGFGAERAELTALQLAGPELSATGSGKVLRDGDKIAYEASIRAGRSPFRAVLAAWPPVISPFTRDLLLERVRQGVVEQFSLDVRMDAEATASARRGEPIPDDSIRADVRASGVRFALGVGLPDLTDASLTALSTGRTLAVDAPVARVDLPKGRGLALSEGAFSIADTWAARPIGRATFRTAGGVDALAALLASPSLKDAAPAQIEPDDVKGRVDLKTTLSLPLVADLKASEVIVQSSGAIANLASQSLLGGQKLEGANLAANYDRGALSLRGDGRINGAAATIEVKQDAKAVGEASVSLTLDQAGRKSFGVSLPPGVSGPIAVKATQPFGRDKAMPLKVDADLTRASIEGLLPGWSKPAGKAARATFQLTETDAGRTDINELVVESSPVMVRGKISLLEDGSLQSASLTQLRLSAGDEVRVEARRDGGVLKLNVRGQVVDARPFLRQAGGAGGAGAGGPPGRRGPPDIGPDLDVDLAIPIITGFNNEALGGATLKASRRGGEFRQFELAARLGRAPLTMQQGREGQRTRVSLKTDDGGGLLRFLDIYRRAFGGDMIVDAVPDGDRIAGEVLFRDFKVRNEPALRRVLSEQFAQQQGSDRVASGRDAGNDVGFTKMRLTFARTPTRVEIRDGVVWGNEIGLTGQGSIDYGRDRVDIAGTFVPGYAVNNAFSQVPIIGRILGGGQYEGLFAVNFRLNGAASAPTMSINPLSAIAPGIFRRFVDPFGGVPAGDLRAPPAAANPER